MTRILRPMRAVTALTPLAILAVIMALCSVRDVAAGNACDAPVEAPGKSLLGTDLRAPERSAGKRAELLLDLEIAKSTMAIAPEREDSYLWLGRRYAYLDRYQEAIEVFTRGLERFPDSYRLLRFRGRNFIRIRRFGEGIADYRRAAVLAAKQEDVFEPDGVINRRHQFIGSYQSNIHYYLAQAYWAKGRYQDAWLQMVVSSSFPLAQNPDRLASTVFWQYLALRRMGLGEEALILVRNVPDGLQLLENHGYYQAVLFFSGRLSAAELLARPDANMRFAHAMWLEFEGDRTASLAALERLIRETPNGYWPAETEYLRMRASVSCTDQERGGESGTLVPGPRHRSTPVTMSLLRQGAPKQ